MSLTGTEMRQALHAAQAKADQTRTPQTIVANRPGFFGGANWRVESVARPGDTILVKDVQPRAWRPEFQDALIRAYRANDQLVALLREVASLASADAAGKARAIADREEFMLALVDRANQLDEHMLRETA
ncbi:MAG: hypothetical protein K2Z25_21080 [Beijerinckiaceae bacterium]|nr:hypothetical protein [Beijerinckiaceae bacterium]